MPAKPGIPHRSGTNPPVSVDNDPKLPEVRWFSAGQKECIISIIYSTMKVLLVVGARPNFMKVAPLLRAISRQNALNKPNESNKTQ